LEPSKEEESASNKKEVKIKNALKESVFQKKNKFISHLKEIIEMDVSQLNGMCLDKDYHISEEEFKFLQRDCGVILGFLLLNGVYSFSDYQDVLVPLYKDTLLIAKRSLGSNDIERIGMLKIILLLLLILMLLLLVMSLLLFCNYDRFYHINHFTKSY
jgi:hypothetical protein